MTCSEHVIYYVLYQNIFYIKNKHFDLNYTSKITKYCLEHKTTPDELVWKEIYVNLKLAKPPDLMNVPEFRVVLLRVQKADAEQWQHQQETKVSYVQNRGWFILAAPL